MKFTSKFRQFIVPQGVNCPEARRIHVRGEASHFQLVNPVSGGSWTLFPGENRVGRALTNDIVLSDESVSRQHCRIEVGQTSVFIEDLESVNGIQVGGEPVSSGRLIPDARFKIGNVELVIRSLVDNDRWFSHR